MSMQRGLIVSVALHSGVALAFAMGLTLRSEPIDQKMIEVPVEIVRFAPDSNPPPGKKPVPKEERKPDADKSTADKAPSARKREDLKQADRPTEKVEEVKPPPPKTDAAPKVVEKPAPKPEPKKVETAEIKPEPTPKKPEPPKREERKVATARPPAPAPKAEAKPKPKADPTPDPKPAETVPEAKQAPDPKPAPVEKAETKKQDPPKPAKKAEPKPKPKPVETAKKKKQDAPKPKKQVADARPKQDEGAPRRAPKPKSGSDFDSLLKSVDKLRTKPDANKERTRVQAPRGAPDNVRSRPLTISEIDAVRRQIRPCWNFPIGAKNAPQLRVQIRLWMNRDGTVQKAQILDAGRMNSDSFYRAAALAAYRAVKNPRCGPLKLPQNKYDRWKVMMIEFDPSEMGDGL